VTRQFIAICLAAILAGISLLAPTLASAGSRTAQPNEIWITARRESDGEAKYLDGSTQQKFDAIMSEAKPGAHIHLGRGLFVTRGVHLKNNWRIQGSGRRRTTIQLADNILATDGPEFASVLYNYDWEGYYDRIEVTDLTLDCNRLNQPSFRQGFCGVLNALFVASRNAEITRVRALGTWANPGEGFPFSVNSSGDRKGTNRVEIDACEVLNPLGSQTAIAAFDQTGGRFSGFIRNCRVIDGPGAAAFGSGGWKNFQLRDNVTRNMGAAIVIDTHDYENVLIQGNRFYATQRWGILYNGSGEYKNIVLKHNLFTAGPESEYCVNTGNAAVSTRIVGNRFIQKSPAPAFALGPKTTGLVANNIVDEITRSDVSPAKGVRATNNRDRRGRRIRLRASSKH